MVDNVGWRAWVARKRDAIVAAGLALGAAIYLLPLRHYGFQINDDGWYLHPVQRMLGGEVLYRDIWTFYAPLEHHLFAALFGWTGPSVIAARTLWVALLAVAVALTWFAARRFAPARLAWIPPLVFAVAPGQWSKAFYGLCSAAFFVAAALAVARPDARRFAVVGLVAGATLVTRQDIGLAQLGLGLALAVGIAFVPGAVASDGGGALRACARRLGALLAAAAVPVTPVVIWYAAHDALAPLVEATLVAAFRQRDAWGFAGLARMLTPGTFLDVTEGRVVGALLLLPAVLGVGVGIALLVRLLRRGFERESLLVGALVLYVAAGLLNTFFQLRLLRLLETGVPIYLLAIWVAARGEALLRGRRGAVRRRRGALAGRGVVLGAALLAAAYLGTIVVGLPRVELSDDYTGSIRARRLAHPIEIWGETLFVDAAAAEEMRLVRHYLTDRLQPGEPIFTVPVISGWYLALEHPNPTRVVHVHFHRDRILTDEQKIHEVQRMLAAGTRYVITSPAWLGWPEPPDPLRRALYQHFHPVREAGSVVVLERNVSPVDAGLMLFYRRVLRGRTGPEELTALERLVEARPGEPLPHALLGRALAYAGRVDDAVLALRESARLDPIDPAPLVAVARIRIAQGRPADARRVLREALAVHPLPAIQALLHEIGGTP